MATCGIDSSSSDASSSSSSSTGGYCCEENFCSPFSICDSPQTLAECFNSCGVTQSSASSVAFALSSAQSSGECSHNDDCGNFCDECRLIGDSCILECTSGFCEEGVCISASAEWFSCGEQPPEPFILGGGVLNKGCDVSDDSSFSSALSLSDPSSSSADRSAVSSSSSSELLSSSAESSSSSSSLSSSSSSSSSASTFRALSSAARSRLFSEKRLLSISIVERDNDASGDDDSSTNDDSSTGDDSSADDDDDDSADNTQVDSDKGDKKEFETQEYTLAAASICGNGILEVPEECDDSNRRDNDGCTSTCLLEIGICGDGVVQSLLGEQCETSLHNAALPYDCQKCRLLSFSCGDGIVDTGEECDAGDNNSTSPDAACRPNCSHARCGDSVLDSAEICDDGNRLNGDGCDRFCRIEKDTQDTLVASEVTPYGQNLAINRQVQTQFGFPRYPNYQQLPYQLPLAQLQPLIQSQGPIGDTGPAAVAIIGAGAAAGFSWIRRKRR